MIDPPEAPFYFITQVLMVDGKRYTVFLLGKYGKEKLQGLGDLYNKLNERTWHLENSVKELKYMLNVLTDIIGGPSAMVEYFRNHILVQLGKGSCRTGVLVKKPYSDFKYVALQELLKEEKIVHTRNGWWKLGKFSKE